ncbi:(2Fe-2S)-binding protein [Sneathiella limimaris]|uniref:(2Fe-2S)-binding protein n=1 Tax=Sneathiella limimaris TaxID=1964213 RepID=UPI00146C80C7|nr:(2Fe-2S)-binding protein [Sneathiella limimaris]
MRLQINGSLHTIPEAWQSERLLFILRELIGLTGAKYGCGEGICGACTVQLDGIAVRSCQLSARDAEKRSITTIEGLSREDGSLHPVQQAWLDKQVPQCGYCQTGQIMSAVALLDENPNPSDDEISDAMSGNLCRCGTYDRIRKAIHLAAEKNQ